jgi:pimeloyl-ACP methyl ester carboxylesterase
MKTRLITFFLCLATVLLLLFSVKKDIPLVELEKKYFNKESKYVDLSGISVHYRDQGKGTPILLIHGTASSLHTWDAWTDELIQTNRVIRLDLPGFGLTGPNPKGDYTLNSYVDIVNQLLDQLKIDSVILVGNSLGGNIAWRYAAEYPEKINKLILIDPSGTLRNGGVPWIFKLARTPILSQILRYVTPRSIIEKNLKEVYFDDSKITDKLIDRYHDMALRAGNRQAFIDRSKLNFEDDTRLLKNISCPTLILWGANDQWIPASNGNAFVEKIAASELVVMPNTGHVPMEERPTESLNFVRPFISNHQ